MVDLNKTQIDVGGVIPQQKVKEDDPTSPQPLELKGKNVIVGVPGAFTGTCHAQVPGYLEAYDKFKEKGVDEIYIFAVNDVFVTKAWKKDLGPDSKVHFIADDQAEFAASIGLAFDATPVLGGPRSKRYVIVTDNDKVSTIAVEPDPGKLTITGAETILAQL